MPKQRQRTARALWLGRWRPALQGKGHGLRLSADPGSRATRTPRPAGFHVRVSGSVEKRVARGTPEEVVGAPMRPDQRVARSLVVFRVARAARLAAADVAARQADSEISRFLAGLALLARRLHAGPPRWKMGAVLLPDAAPGGEILFARHRRPPRKLERPRGLVSSAAVFRPRSSGTERRCGPEHRLRADGQLRKPGRGMRDTRDRLRARRSESPPSLLGPQRWGAVGADPVSIYPKNRGVAYENGVSTPKAPGARTGDAVHSGPPLAASAAHRRRRRGRVGAKSPGGGHPLDRLRAGAAAGFRGSPPRRRAGCGRASSPGRSPRRGWW